MHLINIFLQMQIDAGRCFKLVSNFKYNIKNNYVFFNQGKNDFMSSIIISLTSYNFIIYVY
jgi:hypothetical protein